MIIVVHEGFDLNIQVFWEEVVFQQNAVFQGLVPTLNLALGLRMIRGATRMLYAFVVQPFGQFPGDITGAIITQKAWFMNDMNCPSSGFLEPMAA